MGNNSQLYRPRFLSPAASDKDRILDIWSISPLAPVKKYLSLVLAIGFPIKIDNAEATIFSSRPAYLAVLIVQSLFVAGLSVLHNGLPSLLELNVTFIGYSEASVAEMHRNNMSAWDAAGQTVLVIIYGLVPFFSWHCLRNKADMFTQLVSEFNRDLKNLIGKDEIMSEFRGVGKITLSIIIVFVIATAFYAMFDIILNSKHYGTTTVALQVLCKCLLTALNTFGPASAITMIVNLQIVYCLDKALDAFKQTTSAFLQNSIKRMPREERERDFLAILALGYSLTSFYYQTDVMLGSVLLVEYTSAVLVMTVCGFYSVTVFNAFRSGHFFAMTFCFGMSFLVFGIASAIRVYRFQEVGQSSNTLYFNVRRNLEDIRRSQARQLSDEDNVRLEVLIDRFSAAGPLTPKNSFEMNYSSYAGIVSTIVTYLIVLIEFRTG